MTHGPPEEGKKVDALAHLADYTHLLEDEALSLGDAILSENPIRLGSRMVG